MGIKPADFEKLFRLLTKNSVIIATQFIDGYRLSAKSDINSDKA
jgi:hypothetical protein